LELEFDGLSFVTPTSQAGIDSIDRQRFGQPKNVQFSETNGSAFGLT
jgi:hypothetical protein